MRQRWFYRVWLIALLVQVFAVAAHDEVEQDIDTQFKSYVSELRAEAIQQGFDDTFVDKALATVALRKRVISSDKNQPERKITLDTYLETRVPDWKVKQALDKMEEHAALLDDVAQKYGVQKRFIVALWGNESNFGRIQGNIPVLSALATLAFEGRREALFRKQFFAALQILDEGHIALESFTGSWAGAMGQSQFIPSSFLTYAVDHDGDGRKDIWTNPADVFASIANYLASEGWNGQQTWGRQVSFVGDPLVKLSGLDKRAAKSLAEWQALGVRRFNGADLPEVAINANLIMPDGPAGRAYLVYNNFHTLMKWNRSSYFGISVSYLSERIQKGE
ncbi:lytic murein transglycosylase [Alteromonas oceanisediminis]|uniref:lytic murein transglycosylase n=1 Tax=Alteromonas oceanisediminis TaxID=2836180 RepID=UPI001BD97943|nr:lytic murein transglycosylase [Alteromonas oceanisediminis]MBT0587458.1 lytic murein transglycosylase [Alteromonas oceanisediminis]